MSIIDEKPHPKVERQAPTRRPAEAESPAPAPADGSAPRSRRRRVLLSGLAVLAALAAIAGGADWWIEASKWVSTDDAFIDVHMVQIAPQVAGRVKAVLVNDNEAVAKGQPILEIDPANFRAALDQALANRQSAEGQLGQAKAQVTVAAANLAEAQAQIGVAQAAAADAAANLRRDRQLMQFGGLAVSQQKLENDAAAAKSDDANLTAARQKAAAANAQLGLDRTAVMTAAAGIGAAAAQVEAARLNLSYTEIRAPLAGRVAKLGVQLGDYVETGQDLLALVPDRVWVTANFKETQLDRMRPGQSVEIYVDAYPGHVFQGRVASIQAGSGAAFAVLPPENATGNYVKVVQRVPVKIVFDDDPGRHWLLGPGMSVEPYVKIR